MDGKNKSYQKSLFYIQELINIAAKESDSQKILGASLVDYVSNMLDTILDTHPELFGETNHISYFQEDDNLFEITFENIGKVEKFSMFIYKDDDLPQKVLDSLKEVFVNRISYEYDRLPFDTEGMSFINAMSEYFDIGNGVNLLLSDINGK
jgi:hypothetical protein